MDIFFDVNGNFQWASIAAGVAFLVSIISLSGVIINARVLKNNNEKTIKQQEKVSGESLALQRELNEKNFKGNIVAASRIDWIQEARKLSVSFISSFYNLNKYIKELQTEDFFNEPDHKKRIEKIVKNQKLTDLINILKERGTLLILYFGPDKSGNNEFINYMVTLIIERADGLGKFYDEKSFINQENNIHSLIDFLRIYFKAEWKRANGEIKDNEVQDYLEGHAIYNHINEVYSSGFASYNENIECFYAMKKLEETRST